jgi:predicted TPR repeat methyltransferase
MTTEHHSVLQQAIALQRKGAVERARKLFKLLLQTNPDHVEALHFLGVLEFQSGLVMESIELISQALKLNPEYVDAYINLGNILFDQSYAAEGYACCMKAYELAPQRFDVLENLGVYSRYHGQLERSVTILKQAVELRPDLPAAHYNLGNSHVALKQYDEALDSFIRCLTLDSNFGPAVSVITRVAYMAGRPDVATEHYRKALQHKPDNALVRHMLAAASGENIPDRCTPESVQQLFDGHAASFDKNLAALDYAGPALLAERMQVYRFKEKSLKVLDACCGTGLCAPVLKPVATELDGVDLSAGMLEQARLRQLYDELEQADIIAYSLTKTNSYDLIVSMDSLIYFGRLIEVVTALAGALTDGGVLLFSLERTDSEDSNSVGYHLGAHGRYQHSRKAVEKLAECMRGCKLEIESCVIRRELQQDVGGWFCTVTRSWH